jgi:hypothetical protein
MKFEATEDEQKGHLTDGQRLLPDLRSEPFQLLVLHQKEVVEAQHPGSNHSSIMFRFRHMWQALPE